jgi:histidinol-phosphate aminotransferase
LKFNFLNCLESKRLIVLRTFSKVYGLAGIRIGYGLASRECVEILNRVRQPFNTNSLAQVAAQAALEDDEHIRATLKANRRGLETLNRGFQELGLDFVPSFANFILVKVGKGQEVFEKLLRAGVIVRPMDMYNLPEWLRITVGLPEENKRLLKELGKILKKE